MPFIGFHILTFFTLLTCGAVNDIYVLDKSNDHLKYFGFTLIDTHWDDPSDADTKTNYADEIDHFSNIADMLVLKPDTNLIQRTQYFANLDLKAFLHLNELFFELKGTNSPSGSNYDLRADYQIRWRTFKHVNQAILNKDYIGAFYFGEEPTWNGITFTELNTVTELLEKDFPDIPSMLIEAYPAIGDLQVPETVDWVGFDQYFTKDPNINTEFQLNWAILKSKLSSPQQKIMVILDSHYIEWTHGDFGGIDILQMNDVANNYYELALSDKKVIGLLGYFWPNGFDFPESTGARGMPPVVKKTYQRIGQEITGKNQFGFNPAASRKRPPYSQNASPHPRQTNRPL